MPFIAVEDPADPRVAPYRAVRDRDHATRATGRAGAFVAEGEVVLRILLSERSRFRPLSILIADNRLAALADILPARAADAPVYVASAPVLEGIAGFPVHRGILALGARPAPDEAFALPQAGASLVLGLVGLANHDNVGGAFRNAAAFGADAVLLDATSCDPLYRKAIRVSVGAALTVPFARGGSPRDLVEALVLAGYAPFALSPGGAEEIGGVAWPDRAALLVGAEGAGLPADLIADLRSIRIAMAPGFDSLNVATAAGIALHAAAQGRRRQERIDGRGIADTP